MTAGRHINTSNKNWGTPNVYVNAVRQVFKGKICLDPCSNHTSIVHADNEYILPKDGLKESWDFATIYINPPYGIDHTRNTRIINWFEKVVETRNKYKNEIIMLVPVATNTTHWKKYVFGQADAICFLYDTRLKFLINGKEGGNGAPMSCAMIYYGNNYDLFNKVFKGFGAVIPIRHLKK